MDPVDTADGDSPEGGKDGDVWPGAGRLFDQLPGLALLVDTEGRLICANAEFEMEIGSGMKESSAATLDGLCEPGDRRKAERARKEALETGRAEVTVRLATERNEESWYRFLLKSHVSAERREPLVLITGSNVTQRERTKQRMDLKQAILSSLFHNAGQGMVLLDHGGGILETNRAFLELFGYEQEEIIGRNADRLLARQGEPPGADKDVTSHAGIAGASRYRSEAVSKNGTALAVLVDEVPVTGDQTSLRYRIYSDITSLERERSLARGSAEEQKVLLREINHRVMNNLDLATGFLQLQMYETEDPAVRQALTDTVVRIKSLAVAHDLFRESGSPHLVDMKAYLDKLVTFLRQIRGRTGREKLECRIGNLNLGVESAVPCALLVNELAGAVLEQGGDELPLLSIRLERHEQELRLQLHERGKTLERLFGPEGDDLRYEIVQALLRQLDARVDRKTSGGGTRLDIRFPSVRNQHGVKYGWPEFGE